jgi:anti-sigma B factor antagonist
VPPDFVPKPFHCDVAQSGATVRLSPRGELDMSSVPILEAKLREALESGGRRLVVDLRGLEFMDSTGLTLLTRWGREAERDGYDLALVRGDDRVHRLFELTTMVRFFTFLED